jgi:hypothetical protein
MSWAQLIDTFGALALAFLLATIAVLLMGTDNWKGGAA